MDNDTHRRIKMPESFIDHEKLEVWKKLKRKIQDEDIKKDIDIIWKRWAGVLYKKEQDAAQEEPNQSNHFAVDQVFSPNYTPSVVGSPANIRSVSMYSPSTPGSNGLHFSTSSPVPASPYTPGVSFNQSPFTHARSPAASTVSSPFTPGSCHTPYTPGTPGGPMTPGNDTIVEEISIPVYSNNQSLDEIYKYGKKRSGKFVCLADDCNVYDSKNSKIKTEGVTLQTLKSHALKGHSITVKVKEKKAYLTTPIKCQVCKKIFARAQTLKEHEVKTHQFSRSPSTQSQPMVPEFKEPDNSTYWSLHPDINLDINQYLPLDQIQTVQNYIDTDQTQIVPDQETLDFLDNIMKDLNKPN